MMLPLLLLDVRPPSAAFGLGVLIVLVLAILLISAALIGGFVFLMMRRRRGGQPAPAKQTELVHEV